MIFYSSSNFKQLTVKTLQKLNFNDVLDNLIKKLYIWNQLAN